MQIKQFQVPWHASSEQLTVIYCLPVSIIQVHSFQLSLAFHALAYRFPFSGTRRSPLAIG
jgi:hypothetical protein